MQINDLLRKDLMILNLEATEKEAAIDEMIARLDEQGIVDDASVYKEGIMSREAQTSTGLGDGIAMPHSKNPAVQEPAVLFAKSTKGVEYEALDGQPVELFFMIAAPEGGNDLHLEVLASLSRKLIDADVISQLKNAETPEEVQAVFTESEEEQVTEAQAEDVQGDKKFVVAVTACPTGIAHTYMAEDSLKKKAAEMGVEIRVETNGTDGAKNVLTADEIRRADGVIIAADKKVELARFNGKPVLQRPVSEGINKAEELITKASAGQAAILHVEGGGTEEDSEQEAGSIWQTLYKDLMNGVSHMLPFVVGGGILLAISFLFEAQLGNEHVLFESFNTIGSSAFQFLIPILAGYIAFSIADRPGLLPGMAAGFMASEGEAGFLGGLVAGFVAGYVMNWIKKSLNGMPKSLNGLKAILLYPLLGLLINGLLMFFLLIPIFSGINNAMIAFLEGLGTGNAVILGAVLGGMMSADMGGPINKAAYAFSIGIYTDTGDGSLMAAVMVGGMVPPIAIAIATLFFKNKFTEVERQSGLTNFILGLSFITEGAIPFAASDPMRVIGSSVVGAAIGGGLTQLWSAAIPAPHGGIFVAPIGDNPLLFLVAVLIGSIISGLILGVWKPAVEQTSTNLTADDII